MTVLTDGAVHLDLAAISARCPACKLKERPLWHLGRRMLCGSCCARTLAPEGATAISFGAVLCARRKNNPVKRVAA